MKTSAANLNDKNVYSFIVEWTKIGFSAYSKEYPVITTGESLQEVKKNIKEALELLNDPKKKVPNRGIQLNMDMQFFFKKYRILNAKQLAERIDMNPTLLSQYVSGTKLPSEEQTKKIITGIRKVAKELSAVSLVAHH
ncbi:MAG: type II toxin-antitoxin system HicB family antitoxin [Flavobacteriales bacterium]|nr:type II toxin-antitoxin system HicB family antitoxin [Flavobacteriales bacterium]